MADTIKVYVEDATEGILEYDLTDYTTFPTITNEDLTKLLDTGIISLPLTPASVSPTTGTATLDLTVPLKPLTKIVITDGTKVFRHFIREDVVETFYDVGDGETYSHNIGTIEHTKLLELRPINAITVTQPKGQVTYAFSGLEGTNTVFPQGATTGVGFVETTPSTDLTYIDGVTMKLASTNYTIQSQFYLSADMVAGTTLTIVYKMYAAGVEIESTERVIVADRNYVAEFIDIVSAKYTTITTNEDITMTVTVSSYFDSIDVTDISLSIQSTKQSGNTSVIELEDVLAKVLLGYKAYDMNNTSYTPELIIDNDTLASIQGVVSPEFTWNGYTQQKGFEEVGDLVKAITRMEDSIISYDYVNKDNRINWTEPHQTKEVQRLTLDQYASGLEVNAENVIESVDNQNEVVEPYKNGWFTFRSNQEGAQQLTDTTLGIKTRFNTYEMKEFLAKGFLVTYLDATTSPITTEWDITDYVVEQKKWNVLPNLAYDSTVDRATLNQGKGNTIYFTSNNNVTQSFGYRAPKATSVSLLKDQAIYQIIASVATQITGKTVTNVQPNGGAQNITNLLQTQYRVTHVVSTTINARVHKHNAREFPIEAVLFTNETSKVNDTEKLGTYAQSLANRTGNKTRTINGIVATRSELPEIGNLVNGTEIITSVNVEKENGHYTYQAEAFNNYTEISSFVGIDSAYRQYQVPDTDIVERVIKYEEPITVATTYVPGDESYSIITNNGLTALVSTLRGLTPTGITYHTFQTRHAVKVPTDTDWDTSFDAETEGPVDIKQTGCTSIISVKAKDNWSVDDKSENGYDRYDVSDTTLHQYQNDFLYKDEFGRYDSARYIFYTDGYVDNTVTDGEDYPEINQITSATDIIQVDLKTLADAREAMGLAINIPFFARAKDGVEDLRVYDGMAKYNGFNFQDSNADIVAIAWKGTMPSVDSKTITPSQYLEATSFSVVKTGSNYARLNYTITLDKPSTDVYRGWGLMNKVNNELLFLVIDSILVIGGVTKTYLDDITLYADETKGL